MSLLWRDPENVVTHTRIPQYGLVQFDWNSNVVWRYIPPDGVAVHHDVERLPRGNKLSRDTHSGRGF